MSLNIKNPEAHRLAAEVARLTGGSLTDAVVEALREKLDRVGRKPDPRLVQEALRIGRECAERLSDELKSIDHGELLYDEYGLPK